MKSRKNLLISYGKLTDEDLGLDIKFWQSVSTTERFRAANELIKTAYRQQTGKEPPNHIDKQFITKGSYPND